MRQGMLDCWRGWQLMAPTQPKPPAPCPAACVQGAKLTEKEGTSEGSVSLSVIGLYVNAMGGR